MGESSKMSLRRRQRATGGIIRTELPRRRGVSASSRSSLWTEKADAAVIRRNNSLNHMFTNEVPLSSDTACKGYVPQHKPEAPATPPTPEERACSSSAAAASVSSTSSFLRHFTPSILFVSRKPHPHAQAAARNRSAAASVAVATGKEAGATRCGGGERGPSSPSSSLGQMVRTKSTGESDYRSTRRATVLRSERRIQSGGSGRPRPSASMPGLAPPSPSSSSSSTSVASSSSPEEVASTAQPRKKLCCDACDGKHETADCPYFKKKRETHRDAQKGKGPSIGGSGGNFVLRRARVVNQPGDGSCLFHSMSYGLGGGVGATSLRRQIGAFIASNPSLEIAETPLRDWVKWDSRSSVSTYASRISRSGWGGGIEMAACSRMQKVNVHVYETERRLLSGGGFRRISCFDCPGARKTIHVLYRGGVHYDALVPC